MAITGLQRVQREYLPLNYIAELRQGTGIGFSQVWDPNTESFSPDHLGGTNHVGAHPLVLTLYTEAYAKDLADSSQVTVDVACNETSTIAKSGWRVNGVQLNDLTHEWHENVDYTLSDDGKTLTIYHNVPLNEVVTIDCTVRFTDNRNGDRVMMTTDAVVLNSTSLLEAPLELTLGCKYIKYCPEADDMLEYEYMVGRGLTAALPFGDRPWETSYRKSNPIFVTKGNRSGRKTSGFGVLVCRVKGVSGGQQQLEQVAHLLCDGSKVINNPVHIVDLTYEEVVVDCRTMENEHFVVMLLDTSGNMLPARKEFTVQRYHRPFENVRPGRTSDFGAEDTEYVQSVRMNVNSEELKYPEVYYDIKHVICDDSKNVIRIVGEGNSCVINPNAQNNGQTFNMGFDIEPRKPMSPVLLGDNTYLTNQDGKILLI